MHNKKLKYRFSAVVLSLLLSISTLTACTSQTSGITADSSNNSSSAASNLSSSGQSNNVVKTDVTVKYSAEDENSAWSTKDSTIISLNASNITVDGAGAKADKNVVTITSAGTYVISGSVSDGQIRVDTKDDKTVRLVLNGANITSSSSSPIYILKAKRAVIVLAEGSKNSITDSKKYILDDKEAGEPNSAIFSKSDLTINGTGSLMVNANYKNAITSKDELKIISGNITVNSITDGIQGRDFVAIKNGVVNINAQKDGIKSTNDEDAGKGFVLIEGGTVNITSQEDGIQAETNVLIKTGDIKISSGGGSANGEVKAAEQPNIGGFQGGFGGGSGKGFRKGFDPGNPDGTAMPPPDGQPFEKQSGTAASTNSDSNDSISKKGIKAAVDITIAGGNIQIDSADDSLHSNNSITVNGGTLTASSGDDGIHADISILINNGEINVLKSYEGIESSNITIKDGNIHVNASDDGINISGGADKSSLEGRPEQNGLDDASTGALTVNGGYVYVDANGDGLDSNGSINVTDGTIIVNGPTENNNGALDYNGGFKMTGGYLIAAGSSGMAQGPDKSSTQNTVLITFDQAMTADTFVHIQSGDGKELLTFKPAKNFQTVVISSPKLKKDTSYDIYYGGSSTGTEKNGLYTDGTYSGGTKFKSFTVLEVLSTIGTTGSFGGRGEQGFRGGPGRLPPSN